MNTSLTKIQELELLSALESRAESPLKFAYIGDGYKKWIEIAKKSRENQQIEFEEDMLKRESLPFLLRDIGKDTEIVNIIDFGCGDGVPMLPVFEYLQNIPYTRYIPVDISQNMLTEAEKIAKFKFENVEVAPILFDFEKSEILENILQFAKVKNTRNYFFLLGNTLGNFDNTEKILSNLKLSMFPDDHLIIGNEISNALAASKLVTYYHSEEVFNLVVATLNSYEMNTAFQDYIARWSDDQKQIEMFYVVPADTQISVAEHTVTFEKGEELLLAVSKKFTEANIVEIFSRVGYRIDLFTTNKAKNNSIISVTPSRYRS